jgi:hypothetical protein
MESWRERSLRRKLEQATDPRRPLRRGVFKGERPKGRKARLDELLQAQKQFFYYLDSVENDKGRSERSCFAAWHKERLDQARKRYLEILAGCERDGLI